MTRESVNEDALEKPAIIDRRPPPDNIPFLPFQVSPDQSVPDFLPIGGKVLVRQTSSTHGTNGYITTDHDEIAGIIKRLKSKIQSAVDEISFYESFTATKAETLIISYGVTSRAAKSVFNDLKKTKRPVSLLVLKTIWPVPETVIRQAARGVRRVMVVEMNLGQYVHEIERILPDKPIGFLGQMDGRLIAPQDIKEKIING